MLGKLFQREPVSICTQSLRNCNYLSFDYNLGAEKRASFPALHFQQEKNRFNAQLSNNV